MIRRRKRVWSGLFVVALVAMTACSEETASIDQDTQSKGADLTSHEGEGARPGAISDPALRQAFFGDLHVHTGYSFDAYAFGTLATPDDAYRFAKGEAIKHPAGFDVKLSRPLDFFGVTDHAIYLGVVRELADTDTQLSKSEFAEPYHSLNAPENMGPETFIRRWTTFRDFLEKMSAAIDSGDLSGEFVDKIMTSAWADTIRTADAHNESGEFTSFVGYEFTTNRSTGTLHRNVIFRGSENLPAFPFSRIDSQNPEDLWAWMDEQRSNGVELLAIPHNSNGSDGQAFELTNWTGEPIDRAYAEQRLRNEPLVEITQVKGTSETHPALSLNDEWADFEISAFVGPVVEPSRPQGSYVRDAFKRGLTLDDGGVGNPYQYGVIGSSDTHTAAGSYEEKSFFSKVGLLDSNGVLRGSLPMPPEYASDYETYYPHYKDAKGRVFVVGKYPTWGASGLAGVWADENTREAIFDAFRRKETFATSGPRIPIRLFAGYELPEGLGNVQDGISIAYGQGVAMGGELLAEEGKSPSFFVWAIRDSETAPLQRLQVIKGGSKTARPKRRSLMSLVLMAWQWTLNPIVARTIVRAWTYAHAPFPPMSVPAS